jgi:hypothetical protein
MEKNSALKWLNRVAGVPFILIENHILKEMTSLEIEVFIQILQNSAKFTW